MDVLAVQVAVDQVILHHWLVQVEQERQVKVIMEVLVIIIQEFMLMAVAAVVLAA